MSQNLEKEFVNAGVQSPSEFEVVSDEPATQFVKHKAAPVELPKSRVDSTVQTQDSVSELKPTLDKSQKTLVITLESCDHGKQNSNELNCKKIKKFKNKKKVMEKNPLDLAVKKTTPDLERKKLEAELKATEEIAKIKQSVIEKRLELELASLQDPCNPNIRLLQQSPNNDLKILENTLERNENLIEQRDQSCRSQLLPTSVPAVSPSQFVQATRSPFQPPFPPPISPNQYSRDYPKSKSLKNDCDFLIRNEIKSMKLSPLSTGSNDNKYSRPAHRNIILPERGRFMQTIEKPKYSPPPQQMGMNPFKTPLEEVKYVQSPQISVTEAYYTDRIPEGNVTLQQATWMQSSNGRQCLDFNLENFDGEGEEKNKKTTPALAMKRKRKLRNSPSGTKTGKKLKHEREATGFIKPRCRK